MKCPCKGCDDRTITCHGVCKRYQGWKKNLDETNKWLRDQKPVTSETGIKERNRRLRTAKSRKWNVKNSNGGDS